MIVNATDNIQDFWPPVFRITNKSDYVVFKISLDWLRAMDLTSKHISEKELQFTELHF